MADPRFHSVKGPFSVAALAGIAGARVHDGSDPDRMIRDVAPLDGAGPDEISFLDNMRYLDGFRTSRAGACVCRPDRVGDAPAGMAVLVSEEPYRAYALIAQAFYPAEPFEPGRAASAVVDDSAAIGEGTRVDHGAVIGARAEIGRRCRIGPNAVIGPGVVVGDDTHVGPCASLMHCLVGSRVRLFAGVRIGEDGFGFAPGGDGHVTVPQLGRVIIGDDVEIGANTTIDRGSGPDTVIGEGCRIDNLVQIGHNVRLGRGCIIVAQVGISGSTRLGDHVVVAGQAGLTGHLAVGEGVRIGAQAGVMRDIAPGTAVGGSPAVPIKQWLRQTAILGRLAAKKADRDG